MYATVAKAGLPPTTAAGQDQSNITTFNFKVPNNLATNIGGGTLLESGNTNILINPSFEHQAADTGWTLGGTAGAGSDITTVIHGKKSWFFNATSQTTSLVQSSTLYQAQFADGVQGLASIRVKTNHTGTCSVCSVQAGTVSTTNCVSVQSHNKWGLYKVPMILGATSNGISLACTSGTGLTYVDDAFVGAVDLKADVGNVSNWRNGTCSGTWTTNTAYTCKFRQVGNDLEVQYLITLSGAPNATALYLNLPSGFNIDTTNLTSTLNQASFGDGSARDASTNVFFKLNAVIASGSLIGLYYIVNGQIPPTTASSSTNLAEINATLPVTWASGDTLTATVKVPVTQYSGSGSVYTSTNADTDWASCGLTGAAFTGFGSSVPTPSLQCKREGSDLLIRGTFQAGTTPTAVEARMALPTWNGVQLVSAGSSVIPSVQLAGNLTINLNSTTFFGEYVLIEPSVSYVTFGIQSSTGNAFSKSTGIGITGTGNFHSINARIPISGWTNSNIIIGQFNGLESCADTLECTDTFSAFVSGGAVSNENVDWINGNCTLSGTGSRRATCTLNSIGITSGMTCVASGLTAVSGAFDAASVNVVSTSNTTIIIDTAQSSDGVGVQKPFGIICQKQGADYIGKTAKAVASDQNIATPGVTKVRTCTVTWGGAGSLGSQTNCTASPCTEYYDSCGAVSNIIRNAAGNYTITFASGTFAATTPLSCHYGSSNGPNSIYVSNTVNATLSTGGADPTLITTITSGANTDTRTTMTCQAGGP